MRQPGKRRATPLKPSMSEHGAQQHRLAGMLLWLVPAMWSVNYIIARIANGVIGPYLLALGRWAIAGAVLVVLARSELWQQRAAVAKAWWQFIILGFLGMLVCGAWVYQGARSTSATNIALIYAASPVLIALGAALWLHERMRLRQVAGVVLALAGVMHVVVNGDWARLAQVQFVPGDLWIVAATVSWASYALLQKMLGASRVAVTLYLGPLYGGAAAWLLLGEAPGWHHLAGAALILPGVFLVTWAPAAVKPG